MAIIMAAKKSILQFFEESTSKWAETGESFMLSSAELKLVSECTIKCYSGEYGEFTKLYLSIVKNGKTLQLKGDPDSNGKKRAGVQLDRVSTARHPLEVNEVEEIDPSKVLLYFLKNTEDNTTIMRIRILK